MNYGFHRVIEPDGVIPQAAWRLDNRPELLHPAEVLIRVRLLNLDSTGMSQLRATGKDIATQVRAIVEERGKLHNPATNSGGVLVGEVCAIGPEVSATFDLGPGETIIPVVSTSTLPLHLTQVGEVQGDQVSVHGHAILFDGMGYSHLPGDFDLAVALSAIDISSIVPQVYRSVNTGDTVLVIGAGKSGLTAMAAARRAAPDCTLLALDPDASRLAAARDIGHADRVFQADARVPAQVLREIQKLTAGRGCDVVLNCVNVADTEAASIISARHGGTVFFYSMATRFDRAALGTDATDNDVRLLIGNGVAEGQAGQVFDLLRDEPALREYFKINGVRAH